MIKWETLKKTVSGMWMTDTDNRAVYTRVNGELHPVRLTSPDVHPKTGEAILVLES